MTSYIILNSQMFDMAGCLFLGGVWKVCIHIKVSSAHHLYICRVFARTLGYIGRLVKGFWKVCLFEVRFCEGVREGVGSGNVVREE